MLAWDADLAVKNAQAVGMVLAALARTPDAVVHLGPLLIVKDRWAVAVHQLSPAQQHALERLPARARSTRATLTVLGLTAPPAAPDPLEPEG